ncbi:UNVERIFIED_CONTAM: hypothetical protein H355_005474 [Colinus virginianus]|nr:hypothetical protein H355_005474 [Colinus virginianus]
MNMVGSGSGYLTVAMAYIVGVKGIKDEKATTAEAPEPEGVAVGIDYVPGLVKYSQEYVHEAFVAACPGTSLPRAADMSCAVVALVERDGWEGYPAAAPYDAIHVGAAAAAIPRRLVQQLKNGGKMVLPVEESLQGEILFEEEEDEGEKGAKKDETGVLAGLGRSTSAAEGAGRRRRSAGEGDDESKRGVARASTTASSMWSRLFMGGGGQRFVAVTKDLQGNVHVKKLMGVMYVPLVKRKEPLTIKHDE